MTEVTSDELAVLVNVVFKLADCVRVPDEKRIGVVETLVLPEVTWQMLGPTVPV
jgi:hypothetical protein